MRHWSTLNQKPEPKDIERAHGLSSLRSKDRGHDSPYSSNASKMAKLIKKEDKLIRRSKAVVAVWGTIDYEVVNAKGVTVKENVWQPFCDALERAGFTYSEIKSIAEYEHDDPLEALGLDDLFEF